MTVAVLVSPLSIAGWRATRTSTNGTRRRLALSTARASWRATRARLTDTDTEHTWPVSLPVTGSFRRMATNISTRAWRRARTSLTFAFWMLTAAVVTRR